MGALWRRIKRDFTRERWQAVLRELDRNRWIVAAALFVFLIVLSLSWMARFGRDG